MMGKIVSDVVLIVLFHCVRQKLEQKYMSPFDEAQGDMYFCFAILINASL